MTKAHLEAGHDIPQVKKDDSEVLGTVATDMSKKSKPPSSEKQSVGTSNRYKNRWN